MVKGFERICPDPRPVVYRRVFSPSELGKALMEYLEAGGVTVPAGKTEVLILQNLQGGEDSVVLRIEHFERV